MWFLTLQPSASTVGSALAGDGGAGGGGGVIAVCLALR